MSKTLSGSCYCGATKFTIEKDTTPYKATYCHCESCRRAHACAVYQVVYIPRSDFTLTGSSAVTLFKKPDKIVTRSFCQECGTRIFNLLESRPDWLGFFPNLLDDQTIVKNLPDKFNPTEHYCSEEAVFPLDLLQDGLERT
jgi:hypothetical protein